MQLNADFSMRAAAHTADMPWVPSPMPGVDRRMLDRIGDEVARATSIVRYAAQSTFSPHVHTGGEEFLVLDGVFSDEHGDFPAGSYIRNPPTSRHRPGSEPGCTIFVKLWQFDLEDRTHVRLQTNNLPFLEAARRPGVEHKPLFENAEENVRIERWAPHANIESSPRGGLELLVLEGGFTEHDEPFGLHSWLRIPPGGVLEARAQAAGALLWVKEGHLRDAAKRFREAYDRNRHLSETT